MADVDLLIAGRQYNIACRDGGEAHLKALARHVDEKAREAAQAVGGMSEARQLLFAALLIADECAETKAAIPSVVRPDDATITPALLNLADRMETLADALETGAASA